MEAARETRVSSVAASKCKLDLSLSSVHGPVGSGDLGGDSDNDPSRSESVVRVEGACTDTKSLQRGYGQGVSIILAK